MEKNVGHCRRKQKNIPVLKIVRNMLLPICKFNGKNVIGQEGVLTLDVYRPDTGEKNLPVLVFIHGGNNQTSNSRLWMGEKFAKEANAVYVSVQYRLGLLGFNNLPALKRQCT